ncbi:MAG: alanine racemase [Candidatus Nanopelagicales bacterium]
MDRWIEVDLAAIAHNVKIIKAQAPKSQLMAVVKADAYGHGLIEVSKAARQAGAEWLGTALFEEALTLRESGDSKKILTWLGDQSADFAQAIEKDIDIGISTFSHLEKAAVAATKLNKKANLHLKIDTGLNRNGVSLADLPKLLEAISQTTSVNLAGIMSHFAFPDDPSSEVNHQQIIKFTEIIKSFDQPIFSHMANSMATLDLPQSHFDLVRPGISVYGLHPSGNLEKAKALTLKPALSLKAKIVNLKAVAAEQGVSYNHTYRTKEQTNLAVIPLGYSDGIDRRAANAAAVAIGGKSYKISGRICMEQFVVDVGADFQDQAATVTLFGDSSTGVPSVEDWAQAVGTINYEIISRLATRIKRVYLNQ